jgi:hypothetical protein
MARSGSFPALYPPPPAYLQAPGAAAAFAAAMGSAAAAAASGAHVAHAHAAHAHAFGAVPLMRRMPSDGDHMMDMIRDMEGVAPHGGLR